MSALKWIGRALGKRKWMIGLLGLIQSLLAVSGIFFALTMKYAIDVAIQKQSSQFLYAVIGLIIIVLVQIGLRALNRYIEDDTRAVSENRLRREALHGILQTEYSAVKAFHTGELMNRLTSDVATISEGAVSLFPSILSMAIRIMGILIVMWKIEPWFVVIFFVGGCLVAAFSVLPRKYQKSLHKRVQEVDGEVKSFLQESLESLLIIHAFGCEKKIEMDNDEKMEKHRNSRRKRTNVYNVLGSGLRLFMQGGYIFGFVWCGFGIVEGHITYGTLTAVLQLIGQIQTPFANMGNTFPKYAAMLASAERLMEITDNAEKMKMPVTERSREEIYSQLKNIAFENVSFSYERDRMVLENESFSVNKGEVVALIGSSGIGKSTIMKLLLSVYQPQEGEIKISLEDRTMSLESLPKGMFAYVPQGNYLMSGTIWEVVGFAEQSGTVDRQKVEEACKVACAHEFIKELPKGYDTLLGERGEGLSEGQMQRLAVARAVYSGCPILLLDEATSALDADTERRMILSLKQMKDYTVLLVTHRRDVWELCDRVLERKE